MRIIAGRWRGRIIAAPPGRATRPTQDRVREAWMSALQFQVPGARVLDLFAGSGALGLETLSRGAAHVTFVERAGRAADALMQNIRSLDAGSECTVIRKDVFRFLNDVAPSTFDLALADPPYGRGLAAQLAERFAAAPFARTLWIEHGAHELLPTLHGIRTRRYGDTAITSIPVPE